MAAIAKYRTPSLTSTLLPQNEQIPGLRAGADIGGGDLCTIGTDGLVYLHTAGAVHGVAAVDAQANEPITLYRNVRFGYGNGLTPGAAVYASATVNGGLDNATITTPPAVAIGFVVDTQRIQFTGL